MGRRVWGAIATGMVAAALLPVGGSAAQTGDGTSVTADRDGWWSQSNSGVDSPNGTLTPPIPRSPAVPQGAIPVSAFFGEAQTVAAVGVVVPEGMEATRLVMTLALSEGNGAESSPDTAKIHACPIISFWGATENGKWVDKPEADCDKASVDGTRNDDGTWTFDLTPIAALWADEFEAVPQNGVLLSENADAPATFQIAYEGLPDGITFDAELTEVTTSGGGFDTVTDGGGGFGGGGGGGGSVSTGGGSVDAGPLPAPSVSGGETGAAQPDKSRQAAPGRTIASTDDAGNVTGNLPLGLLILLPFVLAVAVLAGQAVATGRDRPQHVRRQGGVGRALAARTVRHSRPEMP